MNVNETLKILSVLKANYPNFYKGMSKIDAEAQVSLWSEMFEDTPYELVGAAVKSYIASNVEGYPPNIDTIKEQIKKLTQTEEMTEQEAVNLIMKALKNSNYGAEEEFQKLPSILQKLVGSPNMLREWAMMDIATVNSVVSSNLMRSFKSIKETERVQQALPSSTKNAIAGLVDAFSMDKKLLS
jgi:hypothetical protein